MRISEAREMMIIEKKSEGVSNETLRHYRSINYFIDFTNDMHVEDIDRKVIVDYRLYLINKKKNSNHPYKKTEGTLSKTTINTYLRPLQTLLTFLYDVEILDKKIKIKKLKEPKRVIEILNDEEIGLLIDLPEETWLQCRNKLFIYMMLDSGLRRQEIHNLMTYHVDIHNNIIMIRGTKGDKDRNVALGSMTKQLYMKYMRLRPEPITDTNAVFLDLFKKKMSYSAIKNVMDRLKEKTGIRKFHPHLLRHTFATKYLINQYESVGVADIEGLRILLGHEDTSTTRIYLHLANQYMFKFEQFGVLNNVKSKLNQ